MNQSPQQQQQQRRKFQKFAENSENLPKNRGKFLKKKVFFEALITYRYCIVSRKKPSYRIESKKSLSPRSDQNIGWAPVVTRKEEATLLNWSEACGNCSFKNCIRRGVVSTDAFSPRATAECVVAIESVESLTAV